jgi:hypothetical protein
MQYKPMIGPDDVFTVVVMPDWDNYEFEDFEMSVSDLVFPDMTLGEFKQADFGPGAFDLYFFKDNFIASGFAEKEFYRRFGVKAA